MYWIKKRPYPAKGTTRIDNAGFLPDSDNIITGEAISKIQQDAKVLHILKAECNHSGAGHETLTKVFTGLLSVHNRNLIAFADALQYFKKTGSGYAE